MFTEWCHNDSKFGETQNLPLQPPAEKPKRSEKVAKPQKSLGTLQFSVTYYYYPEGQLEVVETENKKEPKMLYDGNHGWKPNSKVEVLQGAECFLYVFALPTLLTCRCGTFFHPKDMGVKCAWCYTSLHNKCLPVFREKHALFPFVVLILHRYTNACHCLTGLHQFVGVKTGSMVICGDPSCVHLKFAGGVISIGFA